MIRDIAAIQAIADLAKGDATRACEILRRHGELDPDLADAIADALEAAKLHKGVGGRPRKLSAATAERVKEFKQWAKKRAIADGLTDRANADAWFESKLDEEGLELVRLAEEKKTPKKQRKNRP